MLNQATIEQKAESVDVKEYLAVLLKRKWLVLVCFLLSMAGTTAFLFTRQPIYRADLKLLVTTAGMVLPANDVYREDEARFYGTQIDIMKSQTMLRRVQQRMKKTADEIRENLTNLEIAPVRNSAIVMISVDSPSRDFARDFANTLADEYLRFRDEQRAQSSESALLMLTREINRLSQELKSANDRLLAYAKEHNMSMLERTSESYYRRYNTVADRMTKASASLADSQTKVELLDKHSDVATVLTVLGKESGRATPNAAASSGSITPGTAFVVTVAEDHSLDRQVEVDATGAIDYPPLGTLMTEGLTTDELANRIRDGLQKSLSKLLTVSVMANATPAPKDSIGTSPEKLAGLSEQNIGSLDNLEPAPTKVNPIAKSPDMPGIDSTALAVISDVEGKKLFDLESTRRTLESKLAEMRKLYKPRHPALMDAEAKLQQVSDEIESEIVFIRKKAHADFELARANFDKLKTMVTASENAALSDSARLMEMKAMRDDADRVQTLYNTLMGQLMKIDVSQGFNARTVSVLEPALLEIDPVYPKKVKGLLVAAFFGLGLGLALAFFIEYIDDSIKLAEEVERDLQLPFLGMIPAAQWSPDDLTAHRLDKLKQQGGVAEAYRVVRSAIIFSTPREKLRSILLTSAVPREGKTTTCVNLSIGFAQIEERVLLIDADLRRGEVHKYFGFEREKGLSDVLLGESTPEQVIHHTSVPKLDVITSGAYPANPAELLLGWRLKETLEWAYKNYDRVMIDCTPVMGIADSAILGSAVDGCLFVIWAGRTSRRYVRVAKMTAVSRGAKIFGFVLNNLEPGRVGYYHYYPYYYSYYSRGYYYARPEETEAGKGGDIKGIEVPTPEGGEEHINDVY